MQGNKQCCCPEKLAEKMTRASGFPLTALIAPLGYGKSTIAQAYLRRQGLRAVTVRCAAGADAAETLAAALGAAAPVTPAAAAALLPSGAVLLLEDYQNWTDEAENNTFLTSMLAELNEGTRMMLLTRRDAGLACEPSLLLHGALFRIEAEDFLLPADEAETWLREGGVQLSAAEAQQVDAWTQGWAAMYYLVYLHCLRGGEPARTDVTPLMAELYRTLPENCRKLLWYLSAAVEFTDEDAALLWGSRDGIALVRQLRREGAPLRETERGWSLHPAFAQYVRQQVSSLNEANQASISRRLGRWYQGRGAFGEALACFEAAGDWEQALCLLEEDAGSSMSWSFAELTTRLMLRCPREVLSRHPLVQFYCARQAATLGSPELLQRWRPSDPAQAALVDALAAYPDLEQMTRHCRAARESGLRLPATVQEPFTLGRLTLLGAYVRQAGQAETALKYLEEYLNLYQPLSGGHGAGALEAARAELCYLRGQDADARIAACGAQLIARENRQTSIQLAALFTLMRCDAAEGAWDRVELQLRQMQALAGEGMLRQTAELAEGWFRALQGHPAQAAAWLREGSASASELLPPAQPDCCVVTGAMLAAEGDWARLAASCQRWLERLRPWQSDLTEVYLYLYLAAAYHGLEKDAEAQRAMETALRLAEPEHWLRPFAELAAWIPPLEQVHPFAAACAAAGEAFQAVRRRAQLQPRRRLAELSDRENQVAQLMCDGMRNTEIAVSLGVSINTVKTTIRHINAKLKLQGRDALRRYMQQV